MPERTPLRAVAVICTLKTTPEESSSELLADQILAELATHEVESDTIRVADHAVLPGITADEGAGDEWPALRRRIEAADIIVLATPTWLGHLSSIAQRVLERLDAELSETDELGRPAMVGKVGLAAIVGNEDGAHKIAADTFQALNDIGFTIPAQGCTYWNGEAMRGTDYKDLDDTPEAVATTTRAMSRNAAHLARLLRADNYPSYT